MATITLAVDGVVVADAWALTAGATKVLAVAAPDDDLTSYVTGTANQAQSFSFGPPTGITLSDRVTNVRFVLRGRSTAGDPCQVYSLFGTTPGAGNAYSPGVSFATTNFDYPLEPGGVDWTATSLASLGIQFENPIGGGTVDVSTVTAIITYTPGFYSNDRLPIMGVS